MANKQIEDVLITMMTVSNTILEPNDAEDREPIECDEDSIILTTSSRTNSEEQAKVSFINGVRQ